MAISHSPRMTRHWNRKATLVGDYIEANPGQTSKLIAHATGINQRTVSQILYHDPRCNTLARRGFVAVVDAFYKDAWYSPEMTIVPVVPLSANQIDPASYYENLLGQIPENSPLKEQITGILRQSVNATLNPTKSISRARRHAEDLTSNIHTLGLGYQDQINEAATTKEQIAQLTTQVSELARLIHASPPPSVKGRKPKTETGFSVVRD